MCLLLKLLLLHCHRLLMLHRHRLLLLHRHRLLRVHRHRLLVHRLLLLVHRHRLLHVHWDSAVLLSKPHWCVGEHTSYRALEGSSSLRCRRVPVKARVGGICVGRSECCAMLKALRLTAP